MKKNYILTRKNINVQNNSYAFNYSSYYFIRIDYYQWYIPYTCDILLPELFYHCAFTHTTLPFYRIIMGLNNVNFVKTLGSPRNVSFSPHLKYY